MELFTSFRWQDGVDILIVGVRHLLGCINLIRGTRAVPMLIGLGIVLGVYFIVGAVLRALHASTGSSRTLLGS